MTEMTLDFTLHTLLISHDLLETLSGLLEETPDNYENFGNAPSSGDATHCCAAGKPSAYLQLDEVALMTHKQKTEYKVVSCWCNEMRSLKPVGRD